MCAGHMTRRTRSRHRRYWSTLGSYSVNSNGKCSLLACVPPGTPCVSVKASGYAIASPSQDFASPTGIRCAARESRIRVTIGGVEVVGMRRKKPSVNRHWPFTPDRRAIETPYPCPMCRRLPATGATCPAAESSQRPRNSLDSQCLSLRPPTSFPRESLVVILLKRMTLRPLFERLVPTCNCVGRNSASEMQTACRKKASRS